MSAIERRDSDQKEAPWPCGRVLMYRTDLAVSWTTQRQQLGFET